MTAADISAEAPAMAAAIRDRTKAAIAAGRV
jgi:hypothetical protein